MQQEQNPQPQPQEEPDEENNEGGGRIKRYLGHRRKTRSRSCRSCRNLRGRRLAPAPEGSPFCKKKSNYLRKNKNDVQKMRSLRAKNKTKRIIFGGNDEVDDAVFNKKKKIWNDLIEKGIYVWANHINYSTVTELHGKEFKDNYFEFVYDKTFRDPISYKYRRWGYTNLFRIYKPSYYYTTGVFTGTMRQGAIEFFNCLEISQYGCKIDLDELLHTKYFNAKVVKYSNLENEQKLKELQHHRMIAQNGFNGIDPTFFNLLYQFKLDNFYYNAIYEVKDKDNVISIQFPLNNFNIESRYFTQDFIYTGKFEYDGKYVIGRCTFTVDDVNKDHLNFLKNLIRPDNYYEIYNPSSYIDRNNTTRDNLNNFFFKKVSLRMHADTPDDNLSFDYNKPPTDASPTIHYLNELTESSED